MSKKELIYDASLKRTVAPFHGRVVRSIVAKRTLKRRRIVCRCTGGGIRS
jgi:hypothetical protein